MTKLFLFFTLGVVLSGCQKETAIPDDGTLAGRFRLEIDPLRCSLPTTQRLSIQATSADTYRFDYDRFGLGTYQLTGIKAVKSSATKYDLTLDDQPIGQYAFEELRTLNGTQKKWVLLVNHGAGQPDGLEFMGVKE
ncbi:hypothetical protein GO730_06760 [Spirosoma sp. HMF3257]|uniref:Lipoprotein n=1 Tax=Spirosoma telluris TaxID=2183553 RepID=A0A327NFL8_9BACT|nr:hypothetical protein [Spirosoma telluris]RAI74111.1 hypothetical protein HMF3257_06700 [Spirosoma telluris]